MSRILSVAVLAYEKLIREGRPDLVVVGGGVNSTVAATLAADKLGVKGAHLEAGLRSFDRTKPEKFNRVVTDSLADLFCTPSPDGDKYLLRERGGTNQNRTSRQYYDRFTKDDAAQNQSGECDRTIRF